MTRPDRRTLDAWALAGWGLCVGLAAVVAYRAATQSVVYDEAFTYLAFLSGSPWLVFTEYTANNHVLFSAMSRTALEMFGPTSFVLRLPSVVFAPVFLGTTHALARLTFGRGPQAFFATAMLTLNPFVLDFLTAARGYGVAIALFMVGLYMLARDLSADRLSRIPWKASVALGLSVCANLTFVVPALAMVLTLTCITRGRSVSIRTRSFAGALAHLLWPGVAAATIVLAVPLSEAERGHFFYGTGSLHQTALSLIAASFWHGNRAWPADPDLIEPTPSLLMVEWGLVLPLLLVSIWWLWQFLRRLDRAHAPDPVESLTALAGGTLVGSLVLLWAGHTAFGSPLPFGRTGLYLAELAAATALGLAVLLRRRLARTARMGGLVLTVVLLITVARFSTEFTTSYFHHWRYDAGTGELLAMLEAIRGNDDPSIRVAVGDVFAASVSFYGTTRKLRNIEFDWGRWYDHPSDFDFFLVSPSSASQLERTAIVRAVHPVSGAVLMEGLKYADRRTR